MRCAQLAVYNFICNAALAYNFRSNRHTDDAIQPFHIHGGRQPACACCTSSISYLTRLTVQIQITLSIMVFAEKSCSAWHMTSTVALGETSTKTVTDAMRYRSYESWDAPEMYNMILKAGYDGAQAIMDSPKGHLMRMVGNIMVRVDVVLGALWDSTGHILLSPMINEMDWFNSAGMLSNFWKGTLPFASEGQERSLMTELEGGSKREARVTKELQSSAGLKIAQALYKEILNI